MKNSILNGFSIVASLDSNEHTRTRGLERGLQNLDLINTITRIVFSTPSALYINVMNPIDTIWTSSYIDIKAISIYPHSFSIGNYRDLVLDIFYHSF